MEVRAGDTSVRGKASAAAINALCGESAVTTAPNANVECASPIAGRYVTLEDNAPAKFDLAEVKVIESGEVIFRTFRKRSIKTDGFLQRQLPWP